MQAKKQEKKLSKKEQPLFTEEERNTIPFVRTVSNKIRNINKKLADIKELEGKGTEQLKPEQKEKISKKDSLLEEITKFEDVLKLYKSIENERKQGQTSEAEKTINFIYVTREIQEHGDQLVTKGVLTADELKTLKTQAARQPKNLKEEIALIKGQVKDHFSSEPKVNLIEKIATHKQFLNLKPKKEAERKASTNQKAPVADKPQKTKEQSHKPKQQSAKHQQIVTETTKVQSAPAPAAVENVGSQQQEPKPANVEQAKVAASAPQTTEEKKDVAEEGKGDLNSLYKNKTSRGGHRSRGAEQWPGSVESEDKFSKEEKAQLAEDGFIFVEKVDKRKVASKHSTKQFGPRHDSRQYHQ